MKQEKKHLPKALLEKTLLSAGKTEKQKQMPFCYMALEEKRLSFEKDDDKKSLYRIVKIKQ